MAFGVSGVDFLGGALAFKGLVFMYSQTACRLVSRNPELHIPTPSSVPLLSLPWLKEYRLGFGVNVPKSLRNLKP